MRPGRRNRKRRALARAQACAVVAEPIILPPRRAWTTRAGWRVKGVGWLDCRRARWDVWPIFVPGPARLEAPSCQADPQGRRPRYDRDDLRRVVASWGRP